MSDDNSSITDEETLATLVEVLLLQQRNPGDTEIEALRLATIRASLERHQAGDSLLAGPQGGVRASGATKCYFFTRGTLTLFKNCCSVDKQTKNGGTVCIKNSGYGCYTGSPQ